MLLHEWRKLCTSTTDKVVERAVNRCKFHELAKLNDPVDRFLDIVDCLHLRNCYEPMEERLAKYDVRQQSLINIYIHASLSPYILSTIDLSLS